MADGTALADGESWTNPTTIEFNCRKDQVLAMPGFQLKEDLEGLARAGHVIYYNTEDLKRHAGLHVHRQRYVYTLTDQYEMELVRYLHNYLTSVTTLIDAQRVVMRHRWGDGSQFEADVYTPRRKAAFETGEAEFMTGLRNYCTHKHIPVPGLSTTLFGERGRPPQFVNELKLDRDKLLQWKKWSSDAKAYLKGKESQFNLLPVIESYMNSTAHFFNWFTAEINKQCAELRDEYLAAAMALKKWYEDETGIAEEFMNGPSPAGNRSERRGQRQQPKRTAKRKRRKK